MAIRDFLFFLFTGILWAMIIVIISKILFKISKSGIRARCIFKSVLFASVLLVQPLYFSIILYVICIILIWKPFRLEIRLISMIFFAIVLLVVTPDYFLGLIYDSGHWKLTEGEIDFSRYDLFKNNSTIEHIRNSPILHTPRFDAERSLSVLYSVLGYVVYTSEEEYEQIKPEIQLKAAFENLIDNSVDVAFLTSVSDEQIAFAESLDLNLKINVILQEPIVFFVNIDNPVTELSSDDIKRIYAGEIKNWWRFGGGLTHIRAYQPYHHSSKQVWLNGFMGENRIIEPVRTPHIMPVIWHVSLYTNYRGALGFAYQWNVYDGINRGVIKLLSIDGIEPNHENFANGTYPFMQNIYAVSITREPENEDDRFRKEIRNTSSSGSQLRVRFLLEKR